MVMQNARNETSAMPEKPWQAREHRQQRGIERHIADRRQILSQPIAAPARIAPRDA